MHKLLSEKDINNVYRNDEEEVVRWWKIGDRPCGSELHEYPSCRSHQNAERYAPHRCRAAELVGGHVKDHADRLLMMIMAASATTVSAIPVIESTVYISGVWYDVVS